MINRDRDPPATEQPLGDSVDDVGDTDSAIDIDALASHLRMTVGRLARRLRQQLSSALPLAALSALAVVEREGPITVSGLALAEGVAPPTITRIARKLTEQGYVERRQDREDRRVARLVITHDGIKALEAERQRKTSYLGHQLQELDPESLSLLAQAVEILDHLVAAAPESS